MMCESAAFNMPANLENSAVATGLEKASFHSNPKERQCQRMLKLLHSCTQLTREDIFQTMDFRQKYFADPGIESIIPCLPCGPGPQALRRSLLDSLCQEA